MKGSRGRLIPSRITVVDWRVIELLGYPAWSCVSLNVYTLRLNAGPVSKSIKRCFSCWCSHRIISITRKASFAPNHASHACTFPVLSILGTSISSPQILYLLRQEFTIYSPAIRSDSYSSVQHNYYSSLTFRDYSEVVFYPTSFVHERISYKFNTNGMDHSKTQAFEAQIVSFLCDSG